MEGDKARLEKRKCGETSAQAKEIEGKVQNEKDVKETW